MNGFPLNHDCITIIHLYTCHIPNANVSILHVCVCVYRRGKKWKMSAEKKGKLSMGNLPISVVFYWLENRNHQWVKDCAFKETVRVWRRVYSYHEIENRNSEWGKFCFFCTTVPEKCVTTRISVLKKMCFTKTVLALHLKCKKGFFSQDTNPSCTLCCQWKWLLVRKCLSMEDVFLVEDQYSWQCGRVFASAQQIANTST
jgi:hypothetical protein